MKHMLLPLVVQLSLAFGVAGLLWPEKLIAVFDVLMFPWPATHKFVRINAWLALCLSVLLFSRVARKNQGLGFYWSVGGGMGSCR